MNAATITPERVDTRAGMTAKEAFDLRGSLRKKGWKPLETSLDFRKAAVGLDLAGEERTIAYFTEFRSLLGGAAGWFHPGRPDVPYQASFVELYRVTTNGFSARWTPAA